jgi:subtilase family serine protease
MDQNDSSKTFGKKHHFKEKSMSRRLIVFLLTIVAVVSSVNIVQAQQALLTRHVREATRTGEAQSAGRLPATQSMKIDIVLPLRHQPELQNFLEQLYDPTSSSYRRFLSPQEFTARFGPSQEDFDALVRFAKANGFSVVGGSRDAMDLQLKGSVSSIEKAFHVTMGLYQHPTENRKFFAPDREPTIELSVPVWHISGLDNYSIPRPASLHKNIKVKSNVVKGSCPGGYYCGSDMRAAYYGGTALTGSGQNLGLLEYVGYDIADLKTYFTNAGQTNNVTVTGVSTDGTTLTCLASQGCDDREQVLDMTQAISMAPGLKGLYVFVGSTDTAMLSSMSTHTPLVSEIGSSWTWQPSDPGTDDPYFQKFAAQGQNYFQAAGDSGAYTTSSSYVYPGDDAYVTVVGGTDLVVASPGGPWSSETAWVDGGGGVYTVDSIPIPSWQQLSGVITTANKGSTTLRNSPDVSAEADFDFYTCADQEACQGGWGGTSFAAPMWAGYMALINQQALLNGNPSLGFINPAVYNLGVGSGYNTEFHDIKTGSNGEPATAGYDLATGWGSPIAGTALINALAGGVSGPNFSLSASPSTLTITQGSNGTSTITVTPTGGFTGSVTLAASGLPSGVTAAFSPNPTSTTSTLTLTASGTAATGTVTVTVTGTSGSLSNNTTLSLTVNTTGGGTTVTVTPASETWGAIVVGATGAAKTVTLTNTGTSTLTISSIATTGDFALTTSAKPCGATLAAKAACKIAVTFTPTQIGTRNGTLTITDNAAGSPQTVALTGTGVAQATLTPATGLTFPAQKVGTTSAARVLTLTNKQAVSLTGISIAVTGDFTVSSTTCTSSLAAKGTCKISIEFKPTATGARTGTASVSDSAGNSPQQVPLKGTGK